MLGRKRKKSFIWGDAVHVAAVQFALPAVGMFRLGREHGCNSTQEGKGNDFIDTME